MASAALPHTSLDARARERDVFSFYPLSLDIPDLSFALDNFPECLPPDGFCPRPSADPVLTSLAQLAALRLDAGRALISLIDSRSQIILAESTCTLPLRRDASPDTETHRDLWLGSVIIPRDCGVCGIVLEADRDSTTVIPDLQQDPRFAARCFVQGPPRLRFYAGAPLVAPTGSIIGTVCVFDEHPRDGLDPASARLLQDIAATTMSYLDVSRAHENSRRAEKMVRGLTSFVTGASDLQNRTELDVPRSPEVPMTASPLPGTTIIPSVERSAEEVVSMASAFSPEPDPGRRRQQPSREEPLGHIDDTLSLQDIILPSGAKRMFSRAANIMRNSSDLSGVVIFDASIANPGSSGESRDPSVSGRSESNWSTAGYESSALEDDAHASPSPSLCRILGFADTERSSRAGNSPRRDYLTLAEADLTRLLADNPHGRIFQIPLSAERSPAPAPTGSADQPNLSWGRGRGRARPYSALNAILEIAPGARSAAIIPLWDFQRDRWFAACFCWTTDPYRLLAHGADLLYLRTFGNSIMVELSRLDTLSIDKAKTTFIESISHELRSPLHGILGGVEYLQGMHLDSFQANIVGSIGMCGRTLLDTVMNMLEYSKINEFARQGTQTAPPHGAKSRAPLPSASAPTVDLRSLTEETVEAVFSGHSYNIMSTRSEESADPFLLPSQHVTPVSPRDMTPRKPVRVIFYMPDHRSWLVAMQPAIWRRIIMNIFGNALKYTEAGFVRIGLSALDLSDEHVRITLTVSDSGVGISPQYLQEGLFRPFSQENPFSAGTGLGLSIVRRLIESLDGKIEVQSKLDEGTEVQVTVTLVKRIAPGKDFVTVIAERVKDRNICIPAEFISSFPDTRDCAARGEHSFISSIAAMLREWFEVDVKTATDNDDQLTIYPGPSLQYMARRPPHKGMCVVVALDAIEAATLRTDARVVEGWIEVITQPCGPSKLGRLLERYINRVYKNPRGWRKGLPRPRDISLPIQDPSVEAEPTIPSDPTTPTETFASPKTTESPEMKLEPQQKTPPFHPPFREQQRRNEILIVDDSALNIRLLSAFLKKHGFPNHTSAQNGLEALNLFKEDPHRWAAVLMDLSMPVMDGIVATREIRAFEKEREKEGEAQTGELWNPGVDKGEDEAKTPTKSEFGFSEGDETAGVAASSEGQQQGSSSEEATQSAPGTRTGSSGVQIIVITGLGSATARFEATNAGADEFMTKPIQFAVLMEMLKKRMEDVAAAALEPPSASDNDAQRTAEGADALASNVS